MNWDKVKAYSLRAGKEVAALAEAVFLTFKDSNISFRHKSVLIGSLVYLLSPFDALPDFIPGGYADDLSVMLVALLATGKVGKQHLKESRIKHGLTVDEVIVEIKEDL